MGLSEGHTALLSAALSSALFRDLLVSSELQVVLSSVWFWAELIQALTFTP